MIWYSRWSIHPATAISTKRNGSSTRSIVVHSLSRAWPWPRITVNSSSSSFRSIRDQKEGGWYILNLCWGIQNGNSWGKGYSAVGCHFLFNVRPSAVTVLERSLPHVQRHNGPA